MDATAKPANGRGEGGLWLQLPASLASLFAPLNSTMIAVALPSIRRDFDVDVSALTWLVSSYLIAVAVCQPAGGRIGDAFGHLRTVKAGLAVLLVFSVLSALAVNFPMLVATRSLQGISAALIAPNVVAYLRKRVAPGRLGSVMGANGAAVSTGAAFGPVLGGLLLFAGDWRWLFVANVPFGLVALFLVMRLPEDKGAGRVALHLDTISLLALGLGFTGLALAGTAIKEGSLAFEGAAVAIFGAGVVLYGARYMASRSGVVDLRLFARRDFAATAAGTALTNMVMYTILIAMPVYLGDVEGSGDAIIGLVLFAMSAAMIVVGPFSGRLSDGVGSRPLLVAGAMLLLVAAAGLALVAGRWPVEAIVPLLLLIGLGMGLLGAPQQSIALRAWPVNVAGSAAGTYSMMRYVGSVAGTALLAAVVSRHAQASEFRELFLLLALVAVVNTFTGFAVTGRGHPETPQAGAPAQAAGATGG
jgi:EmrB/QacA subfamily drug resistance transporter